MADIIAHLYVSGSDPVQRKFDNIGKRDNTGERQEEMDCGVEPEGGVGAGAGMRE